MEWVEVDLLTTPQLVELSFKNMIAFLTVCVKYLLTTVGHFVRVLVEIDLTKPIQEYVMVERIGHCSVVSIGYENLPSYCSHCKTAGHHLAVCRKKRADETTKVQETTCADPNTPKDQPCSTESSNVSKNILDVNTWVHIPPRRRQVYRPKQPNKDSSPIPTSPKRAISNHSPTLAASNNRFTLLVNDPVTLGGSSPIDNIDTIDPTTARDQSQTGQTQPAALTQMIIAADLDRAGKGCRGVGKCSTTDSSVLQLDGASKPYNPETYTARKNWADLADDDSDEEGDHLIMSNLDSTDQILQKTIAGLRSIPGLANFEVIKEDNSKSFQVMNEVALLRQANNKDSSKVSKSMNKSAVDSPPKTCPEQSQHTPSSTGSLKRGFLVKKY